MSRLQSTTSGEDTTGASRKEPLSREARERRDREILRSRRICPFCGNAVSIDAPEGPCPRCTMEDSPATRQATKARIGPWHVLQTRNPSAPGMRFETLLSLVAKGQVTVRSIVRGPSTHQLWRFAGHVRGLSREFGICFSCGQEIDRHASICPHCERSQELVGDPNALLEVRPETRPVSLDDEESHVYASPGSGRIRPTDRLTPPSERPQASPQLASSSNGGRVSRGRVSAMDLATALQQDPALLTSSGRISVFRVLAVALFLIAVGMGGLMYLRPDYRAQAGTWIGTVWDSTRVRAQTWFQGVFARTSPATTEVQPPAPPLASPTPGAPQVASLPKPQERTEQPTPPTASATPQTVVEAPVTRGAIAAPALPSRQETPPPDPVPLDFDAALAMSRDLYRRAIDAEGRRDYAAAARLYEQILRLPREVQHADVGVRLANVRRLMGSP